MQREVGKEVEGEERALLSGSPSCRLTFFIKPKGWEAPLASVVSGVEEEEEEEEALKLDWSLE